MILLIYLSSGLFLAWSLGANHAANVFGPAVSTKMVKFRTAAIVTSVFVILGAVYEGAGASQTLGKLGSVNALGGAFTVALAAAITVTGMTKMGLPVSTSQAIVGGIIGWNYFSGSLTDYSAFTKIFGTWIMCPVLAAIFSYIFYKFYLYFIARTKIHLLRLDAFTRMFYLIVTAFCAYSLGANNIANAMGVFVPASPFHDISIMSGFSLSGTQVLFLIGSIAIGVGVFTYSHNVIRTVGNELFRLSSVGGLIVIMAEALVLFIFGSQSLHDWMLAHHLPAFPLVPVSSSQAVVGGVIGIAIAKGGRNIQFRVLGRISMGWITTPLIACAISFVLLFFVQNVFDQKVHNEASYDFDRNVITALSERDIDFDKIEPLKGTSFKNARALNSYLTSVNEYSMEEKGLILAYGAVDPIEITSHRIHLIQKDYLSKSQLAAIEQLDGTTYKHRWQFEQALTDGSDAWKIDTGNDRKDNETREHLNYIMNHFRIK